MGVPRAIHSSGGSTVQPQERKATPKISRTKKIKLNVNEISQQASVHSLPPASPAVSIDFGDELVEPSRNGTPRAEKRKEDARSPAKRTPTAKRVKVEKNTPIIKRIRLLVSNPTPRSASVSSTPSNIVDGSYFLLFLISMIQLLELSGLLDDLAADFLANSQSIGRILQIFMYIQKRNELFQLADKLSIDTLSSAVDAIVGYLSELGTVELKYFFERGDDMDTGEGPESLGEYLQSIVQGLECCSVAFLLLTILTSHNADCQVGLFSPIRHFTM